MSGLTENQKDRLARLLAQISTARDEAWEAYETTRMSDAKWFVHTTLTAARADDEIPTPTREALCALLEAAWSGIAGDGTTHERALKSHAELAAAERYIQGVLAGETE